MPECPECEIKILLNGGRLAANTYELCEMVRDKATAPGVLSDEAAEKVIKHLNAAEDHVDAATKEFLRGKGYKGPLPHSLDT